MRAVGHCAQNASAQSVSPHFSQERRGAAFLSTLCPECSDSLIWKVNMSYLTGLDDHDLRLGSTAVAKVALPVLGTLTKQQMHRTSAQVVTKLITPAPSGSLCPDKQAVRFDDLKNPPGYTFYTQIDFSTYSSNPICDLTLKWKHSNHEIAITNNTTVLTKYSTNHPHPFT